MTAEEIAAVVTALGVPLAIVVVTAALVVSVAVLAARAYVERFARQSLEKQLETHRHELQLQAEAARFDFQRRLTDAGHYIGKRHEAAAEVYRAYREAHGLVMRLRGFSSMLTYEEFNREDMQRVMETREVPLGKQEDILSLWDTDREAAKRKWRPYERMLDIQYADRKLREATNAAMLNELYFPDEVIRAIDALHAHLVDWLNVAEHPPAPGEKVAVPPRAAVQATFEHLHTVLRDLLAGTTSTAVPVKQAP
jgi:hypothetical protein